MFCYKTRNSVPFVYSQKVSNNQSNRFSILNVCVRERKSISREWEREWKSVSDSGIVCNVHCKQILSSKGNRIRIANDQKPKKKKLKEKHKQKTQKFLYNTTTTLRIFNNNLAMHNCIIYHIQIMIYHRLFTKIFQNCAFLYYVRLGLSTLYIFSLYEYENICYIYIYMYRSYICVVYIEMYKNKSAKIKLRKRKEKITEIFKLTWELIKLYATQENTLTNTV